MPMAYLNLPLREKAFLIASIKLQIEKEKKAAKSKPKARRR
jgi:hypothetical protein